MISYLRSLYSGVEETLPCTVNVFWQARAAINDLDLAKKDFELVLKVQPNNREAQQQLNVVNSRIKHHVAKERVIFGKVLQGSAKRKLKARSQLAPICPGLSISWKIEIKKKSSRRLGSRERYVVFSVKNVTQRN